MTELVLSLFPGIGMLDKGFEEAGFCVVRGPDLIFGGDIRNFRVPSGKFDGVIGGPPCQDFSKARRSTPTGNGNEMLAEFQRIVQEAMPTWWLAENVPCVPDIRINGYSWQRLDVSPRDFGARQVRNRHIQFGSNDESVLVIERYRAAAESTCTVTTGDRRPVSVIAELQGLPSDFDVPAFSRVAVKRAIGNGVHIAVSRALAIAVTQRSMSNSIRLCSCGCGRPVTGRQKSATGACRKRLYDRRKLPKSPESFNLNQL